MGQSVEIGHGPIVAPRSDYVTGAGAKRPLRYRGANLRSERDRQRLRVFGALVLTAFCLYTAFVVVRALVLVAEGARDRWQFWPALLVIGWIGVWAGIVALRKWRRIAAQRGPTSN